MISINTIEEKKRALEILSKAFQKSPGMTWMMGEDKRNQKLKKFLDMFLLESSVNNGAFLTSDNNGVVLFFQLQNQKGSFKLSLKKLYVLIFLMGFKRGIKAIKYKKMINQIRPKKGWFGWLVATDNEVSGNAAAYEIKNWMFKMSDLTNEPIYVETTVLRVMKLYKAAGYIEYAKIKHPYEDINVWFMKREPNFYKR